MNGYQDNDWQMMTAEEVAYQGGRAAQNLAATAPISQFFGSTLGDDETHAIRFQALDPETGDPMPKCAYILMRENGAQHGGVTDREGFGEQKDKVAVVHDEPTEKQLEAVSTLVKTLLQFFDIKTLGGHREFAKTHGTSRACPGVYGMIIADIIRRDFNLAAP